MGITAGGAVSAGPLRILMFKESLAYSKNGSNSRLSAEAMVKTSLPGRIKNTNLPSSNGLNPLFEAIVNSIQAIDMRRLAARDGLVKIEIIREQELQLDGDGRRGRPRSERVESFRVTDNGIGFDDANIDSFETLDSPFKADMGCRGLGRILWLKAFERVEIDSVFSKNGRFSRRRLSMTEEAISREEDVEINSSAHSTSVRLYGFRAQYREAVSKGGEAIARAIVEHCLLYFFRDGGAPKMVLVDDDMNISLQQIYEEYQQRNTKGDDFVIKGQKFSISHARVKPSAAGFHAIKFTADNRLVKTESLRNAFPGLSKALLDGSEEFRYQCYVWSPFLNDRVRPERTGFNIPEESDGLLSDLEPSFSEIRKEVVERTRAYLEPFLAETKEASRKRINSFVSNRAPKYRYLISRLSDDDLIVDPDIGDPELDAHLNKLRFKAETEMLEEGQRVLHVDGVVNPEEYDEALKSYLSQVSDFKKSDLAEYVLHRRIVLDVLKSAIAVGRDGKYLKENVVHQILIPLRSTSDEVAFDDMNLWLLDERLAFHDYLASDKPFSKMDSFEDDSQKRPDVVALRVFDEPLLVSESAKFPEGAVTIIELKRPTNAASPTSNKEEDPISQAMGYLRQIREGNAFTKDGRRISNADEMPAYIYVVCELTPEFRKDVLFRWPLKNTPDRLGLFGYVENANAYIQILSFDGLLKSASERNKAFFDKLNLPML